MSEETHVSTSAVHEESSDIVHQATLSRSPALDRACPRSEEARKRRLDNFFKGKARAVYSVNPDLQTSLSSPNFSLISVEGDEEPEVQCERGCTVILGNLKSVFDALGRHSAIV